MHKLKTIALIATIFISPFMHGMQNRQLFEDLDLAIAADQLRAQRDLNAVEAKGIIATVMARLTHDDRFRSTLDSTQRALIVAATISLNPDIFRVLTANAAPNEVEGIASLTHETVVAAAGEYVAKLVVDAAQARLLEAVRKDESMSVLILAPACDLDMRDGNTGLTALHIASQNGFLESVKDLIIRNKANVNIEDNQGRTPLALARENGHTEIIKLLMSNGAQEPENRKPTALEGVETEEAAGPEAKEEKPYSKEEQLVAQAKKEIVVGEKGPKNQEINKPKSVAKKSGRWSWCS